MALSRIVVSVTTTIPVASVDVVAPGTISTSTVGATSSITRVVPLAAIQWIAIVLDAQLDFRGLNPVVRDIQVVVDVSLLNVGKGFSETKSASDQLQPFIFNKGLTESKTTSDLKTFSLARTFTEAVQSTDDVFGVADADDQEVMFFTKGLPTEAQTVTDVQRNTVGKSLTEAKTTSDNRTSAFGKSNTESKTATDVRVNAITKSLADMADAGDEFNATALTDDGEIMVFGKTMSDTFGYSDSTSLNPNKGISDQQTTSDELQPFILGKGIADVPLTSETRNVDLVRGAITDVPVVSDAKSIGYESNFNDYLYNPKEGPKQVNNYALDYFASEDYCLEGFPAFVIGKVLLDTVVTTDDFYGAANADDDETMSFVKQAGDLFYATDSFGGLIGKGRTDSANTADSKTLNAGKVLLDTFVRTDVLTSAVGKALADAFTSSDARTNLFGKGLTDSSSTSETKAFAFSKSLSDTVNPTDDFYGVANPDDDEVMSFFKTTSDSFTKSDSTSLTPGKGLTDSVSKSDGGSLVWTDYWDINYTVTTSGVYVGNYQNF
jgi:hypothetical protein